MTARLRCTCFTDRAVKRWELSSLYRIARASNYVSATGRFCAMFILKCNFLYSSDEVPVNKIANLGRIRLTPFRNKNTWRDD